MDWLVCAVFVYHENNKIQSHTKRATKTKHAKLDTRRKRSWIAWIYMCRMHEHEHSINNLSLSEFIPHNLHNDVHSIFKAEPRFDDSNLKFFLLLFTPFFDLVIVLDFVALLLVRQNCDCKNKENFRPFFDRWNFQPILDTLVHQLNWSQFYENTHPSRIHTRI